MEEDKGLKVTDCSPTEATIYADFKDNPADPWEFELDEIELID